ncbi:hypothetical protein BDA96_10G294900 [Sorghum bicolor]|uniref:Uncharacterized protein n=1 Tax=Sorghum bicolor TaxID=4558 RepID=A0A921Q580_SORBI|nr:hypothetical protein BDA96_10G294900 [Sorghum bicolor]
MVEFERPGCSRDDKQGRTFPQADQHRWRPVGRAGDRSGRVASGQWPLGWARPHVRSNEFPIGSIVSHPHATDRNAGRRVRTQQQQARDHATALLALPAPRGSVCFPSSSSTATASLPVPDPSTTRRANQLGIGSAEPRPAGAGGDHMRTGIWPGTVVEARARDGRPRPGAVSFCRIHRAVRVRVTAPGPGRSLGNSGRENARSRSRRCQQRQRAAHTAGRLHTWLWLAGRCGFRGRRPRWAYSSYIQAGPVGSLQLTGRPSARPHGSGGRGCLGLCVSTT